MAQRDKLVRDNIPAIIQRDGKKPITRVLAEDEYVEQLERKLQEEVTEYVTDKNGEELADILEVVYTLGKKLGYSKDDLEALRAQKAAKNGAFENRTYLISIEE